MKKTLKDCAECEYVSYCDAHMSDGTYHHKEGKDPCQVTLKEENRKKKPSKSKKRTIGKHKSK
jgi:hypothetical protein